MILNAILHHLGKLTNHSDFDMLFMWIGYKVANPDALRFYLFLEFSIDCINSPARVHDQYKKAVFALENMQASMASLISGFRSMKEQTDIANRALNSFHNEARKAEQRIINNQNQWQEE